MSRSGSAPASRNQINRPARPVHKSRGGMLLGIFVGLLLGVMCALGVVWYINKTPLPFSDKTSHVDKSENKADNKPASTSPSANQTPQSLPGKPGDKAIEGGREKPRFEFYKILPGGQEATPGASGAGVEPKPAASNAATNPNATNATNAATGIEQPNAAPPAIVESYYLQAGAFQKAADADNLKAKFALMGLETSVQEVNVADKGTMHRVRVGPFSRLEEMNRVRTQLSQSGIQATVIKIKETAGAH